VQRRRLLKCEFQYIDEVAKANLESTVQQDVAEQYSSYRVNGRQGNPLLYLYVARVVAKEGVKILDGLQERKAETAKSSAITLSLHRPTIKCLP
jgi:hypothetical protein